jgi:hypothetical protein
MESSIHKGTLHGSISTITVTSPGHLSAQGLRNVLVHGGGDRSLQFRGGGGRGRRLLRPVWLRACGWGPGGVRVPVPRTRRWSASGRREGLPRAVQGGRCGSAAVVGSTPHGAGALWWRALAGCASRAAASRKSLPARSSRSLLPCNTPVSALALPLPRSPPFSRKPAPTDSCVKG